MCLSLEVEVIRLRLCGLVGQWEAEHSCIWNSIVLTHSDPLNVYTNLTLRLNVLFLDFWTFLDFFMRDTWILLRHQCAPMCLHQCPPQEKDVGVNNSFLDLMLP